MSPNADSGAISAATVVAAEGARVGFVTCLICGAALLLDPRSEVNVPDLHAAWHASPNDGSEIETSHNVESGLGGVPSSGRAGGDRPNAEPVGQTAKPLAHNTDLWTLTARHGDDLGEVDFTALQTIRRTLLGMLGHGFIADLNTYSGHDLTVWSYRPGTEDPAGIMAGLLDVVRAIAPANWVIEVTP